MIPEPKKSAVARALKETFGVSEPEEIRMLSASSFTSALVFRIVVRERPYLLRLITRTDANTDPTRQFLCMKIAAEAGLSPRVRYTNIEDRVSIIDFVEARPLPVAKAVIPVAATLKAMHGLPSFSKLTNDFDTAPTFLLRSSPLRDGFIQKFQAAKILPQSEMTELFKIYERVRGVYPFPDSDLVSSHNDLKPPNMVFDGQHLWLIDWEAAFLNDRYNDLAVMANFVVANDADENAYLRAYFGEEAGEYRTARYYLMRQLVHIFYAMVYTQIGSAGKPVDGDAPVPNFRDFHSRIWTGEVTLDGPEMKVQFGRAHMRQLLQNAQTERFQDAIRIAAGSRNSLTPNFFGQIFTRCDRREDQIEGIKPRSRPLHSQKSHRLSLRRRVDRTGARPPMDGTAFHARGRAQCLAFYHIVRRNLEYHRPVAVGDTMAPKLILRAALARDHRRGDSFLKVQ